MIKTLQGNKHSFDNNILDQAIAHIDIKRLTPFDRNARKHSKKQIKQIAASIAEFGFTNPILIDQNATILAGHGRVEAAKRLGMIQVPCVYIEHLSEEQKRAFVLADNQLALNATWDEDLLSQELKALSQIDLSFDIETTGFSIAEIDQLIGDGEPEEDHDPRDDVLPDVSSIQKQVQLGDVWQLGQHRLICGDSLDSNSIALLMDGAIDQNIDPLIGVDSLNDGQEHIPAPVHDEVSAYKGRIKEYATMVFTDPPYNVKIDGHVGGKGKIKHEEFAMASGEMSQSEFTGFLRKIFENLTAHAKVLSEENCIRFEFGLALMNASKKTF